MKPFQERKKKSVTTEVSHKETATLHLKLRSYIIDTVKIKYFDVILTSVHVLHHLDVSQN